MSNFFKNIHPLLRRGKRKDEYDDSNFAVLNALNYELTQAEQETISSKIHSSLESATGEFLDAWGAWFGVYRKDGWTDEYYRKRIIRELLLKRGTVPAIIEALVDFLEDNEATVTIYEPWRNIFYTNKSDLNGEDHLMGYYYRFAIIDISIDRPFPPEIVEVIQSFKPAGVLFYIRLDTSTNPNTQVVDSPYVYLDVNNKTEIEQWLGLKYDVRGNLNLNNQIREVVDDDIFHTNDSSLNSTDVLAGSFSHDRGYLHLASASVLKAYVPTATTTLNSMMTELGEAGQDMYIFTENADDRSATIQVPLLPNAIVNKGYAWSADGSDRFTTAYPTENLVTKGSPDWQSATALSGTWDFIQFEKFEIGKDIQLGETLSFSGTIEISSATPSDVPNFGVGLCIIGYQGTTPWSVYSDMVTVSEKSKVLNISRVINEASNITHIGFAIRKRGVSTVDTTIRYKNLKGVKGTITQAQFFTTSPKTDLLNAYPTYIGSATTVSSKPADYTWYPNVTTNASTYVAFDVNAYITNNFSAEYAILRAKLSETDALNTLLSNPVISSKIRGVVSPTDPLSFTVSIYDFSASKWFSLGTNSISTTTTRYNMKFNRAVDYINDNKILFLKLEFVRKTKTVTAELDMLNFTFNCRLGDGYEVGLQSKVEALTDTPVNAMTLSKSTVTIGTGETTTLSATLTPATASVQTVEWSIEDSSIATVNASGKVTGVSEGRTTLTAYADDKRVIATCEINVVIRPTSITLNSAIINFNT